MPTSGHKNSDVYCKYRVTLKNPGDSKKFIHVGAYLFTPSMRVSTIIERAALMIEKIQVRAPPGGNNVLGLK
jgi:hypothetical protein